MLSLRSNEVWGLLKSSEVLWSWWSCWVWERRVSWILEVKGFEVERTWLQLVSCTLLDQQSLILELWSCRVRKEVRGSENTKSIFKLVSSTEVWGYIYISKLIVVLMGKQVRRWKYKRWKQQGRKLSGEHPFQTPNRVQGDSTAPEGSLALCLGHYS